MGVGQVIGGRELVGLSSRNQEIIEGYMHVPLPYFKWIKVAKSSAFTLFFFFFFKLGEIPSQITYQIAQNKNKTAIAVTSREENGCEG